MEIKYSRKIMVLKSGLLIILTFTISACNRSETRFSESIIPETRCEQLIESIGAMEAYSICLEDARANIPQAQHALGKAFESGALGEEHKSYAVMWFERAIANHHLESELYLADYYLSNKKVNLGVQLLEKAAHRSELSAQKRLAKMYYEGKIIKKNIAKAKAWFEKAAEANDAQAQYILYQILSQSEFLDEAKGQQLLLAAANAQFVPAMEVIAEQKIQAKAYDAAALWLARASKANSSKASYLLAKLVMEDKLSVKVDVAELLQRSQDYSAAKVLLAKCYIAGKYVRQDIKKAQQLLKQAAYEDEPEAFYEIAIALLRGDYDWKKDNDLAIKYLKKAADMNFHPAKVLMATLFIDGESIIDDKNQVITHLALMAISGDAQAQYKLAKTLADFSIPVYDRVAIFWLEKAANYHQEAAFLLANFYQEGIGTEINLNKAFSLYHKLASEHYAAAYLELAKMYFRGTGIEKDASHSKKWLTQAIKAQVPEAKEVAQEIFKEGFDVAENNVDELLDFAAYSNVSSAIYKQGKNYLEGTNGYQQDWKKGLELIEQAAAQSYPLAQRELGIMYENDLYEKNDIELAVVWYRKAALQGDDFSQYRLAHLYFNEMLSPNKVEAYAWANLAAQSGILPAEDLKNSIYETLNQEELDRGENLSVEILGKYKREEEEKEDDDGFIVDTWATSVVPLQELSSNKQGIFEQQIVR